MPLFTCQWTRGAAELGVYGGMPVVVFCENCADEFEFDRVLSFQCSLPLSNPEWVAIVDASTFRRIR